MGLKATVTKNGMSGDLYLTIITAYDRKNAVKVEGDIVVSAPETYFLIRGFESREKLQQAISGEIKEDIVAYEKDFTIPLVDLSKATRPQIYKWLKENKFPDAVDVLVD